MSQAKRKKCLESGNELMDGWQERSKVERRTERDNRTKDCKEYFLKGGKDRRKMKERRQSVERRDGWMRLGKWCSVSVFDE